MSRNKGIVSSRIRVTRRRKSALARREKNLDAYNRGVFRVPETADPKNVEMLKAFVARKIEIAKADIKSLKNKLGMQHGS